MRSDHEEDQVLSLITKIYDAALDPHAWHRVMGELRQLFEGAGVILFTTDNQTGQLTGLVQNNMPDDGLAEYEQHYVFIDPRVRFTKSFPNKKVAHDYLFTNDSEIRKNEYYNWLLRHGFRYFLGTRLQVTDEITARFAVQFSSRQKNKIDFDSIKLLEMLLPHIKRALQVNQRINVAEASLNALMEACETLWQGVILLDQKRDVFYMNRPAQRLLQRRDGLLISRRRIHAMRPSENRKLNACLAAAVGMHESILADFDGLIEISRPSGGNNISLIILPVLSRALLTQATEKSVAILINDPTVLENVPAGLLKNIYGLTSAEARLAAALVHGLSVKEYAALARITENTARWQLKHVLSKTQTKRQSELIKLILTGPARFNHIQDDI